MIPGLEPCPLSKQGEGSLHWWGGDEGCVVRMTYVQAHYVCLKCYLYCAEEILFFLWALCTELFFNCTACGPQTSIFTCISMLYL